jgi:GDP-4-dehydro-6-deoxy-D-mannose reductase
VTNGGSPVRLDFQSILVTGAGGFVGSYLLPQLRAAIADGARITACVREADRTLDGVTTAQVDIGRADEVNRLVETTRPDLLIHLAALASVGQSATATATTWQVNVGGTLNLATALRAHSPSCAVLFGSSVEVYGARFNDGVVDEQTQPAPLSPYARSKQAAEWVLGDVLSPDNRLIVARPCNHSGPGQTEDFVLPAFAAQIAAIESGRQPPVLRVGNLDAARDFLDVRDVVDAYLALLAAAPTLPARSTFNIASGQPQTIASMLDRLLALSDTPIEVERDPARLRPSDVPSTRIDAARLREATGWKPTRAIDAMIADLLASHRER